MPPKSKTPAKNKKTGTVGWNKYRPHTAQLFRDLRCSKAVLLEILSRPKRTKNALATANSDLSRSLSKQVFIFSYFQIFKEIGYLLHFWWVWPHFRLPFAVFSKRYGVVGRPLVLFTFQNKNSSKKQQRQVRHGIITMQSAACLLVPCSLSD